jgi:hypothetical protein
MSATPNVQPQVRLSLLAFRISIGLIALLFLGIIIVGNIIVTGTGILDAISAYYYSAMKTFFIGLLCVLGTLLISYRYQRVDTIAGIVAGLFVIGLVIFPRGPGKTATPLEIWIGKAHWAFAIGFLLTIVFIVLYLFTLTDQNHSLIQPQKNWFLTIVSTVCRPFMRSYHKTLPRGKFWRNWVYLVCGSLMIAFLVLCLVDQVFFSSNLRLESMNPVFWCEIIPLVMFSIAWIVKGVGIWQDKTAKVVLAT